MKSRSSFTLLITTFALILSGCATFGGGNEPEVEDPMDQARQSVYLQVENHNWSSLNVYVIQRGTEERAFSQVSTSNTTEIEELHGVRPTSNIHVILDPTDGRDKYVIRNIQVFPGALVKITAKQPINFSNVSMVREITREDLGLGPPKIKD